MKVRVVLVFDVDEKKWGDEYGVDRSEVRSDVKQYIGNTFGPGHHLSDDGIIRDVDWH